jgi:hypothetical protein
MAETKITKGELINISDSLGYLAQKETSAWYQIGKNLRLVKSFMQEVEDVRKDIQKNLALHDENGNIVTENNFIVWKDENSDIEQKKIWNDFVNEDAPIIDWHKFNLQKLDGVELNAGLLSNLLDVIIIDNE